MDMSTLHHKRLYSGMILAFKNWVQRSRQILIISGHFCKMWRTLRMVPEENKLRFSWQKRTFFSIPALLDVIVSAIVSISGVQILNFAGINFREWRFLTNFPGIYFREWRFLADFAGIYFHEFEAIRENKFPRKFLLAKVSSREYFFP